MARLLEMPKLSPTMTEGQLTVWHKKEGDAVNVDDLLAEVETDKATMEFRAFDKGTLLKLLVPEGSTVSLGQSVAILGNAGEDISQLIQGAAAPASPAPAPASNTGSMGAATSTAVPTGGSTNTAAPAGASASPAAPAGPQPPAGPETRSQNALSNQQRLANEQAEGAGASSRVKASPYVRKVARERDLDLRSLPGSGPHGRIVARDLEGATSQPSLNATPRPPSAAMTVPARHEMDDVRPLSMMRKTIARRLTESKQTVPHFYLTIDVDVAPLANLRERINDDLRESKPQQEGSSVPLKVSLNDLLIKACAVALRRAPECNASFSPEALLLHRRVDISVAVAVPDGLLTPVIRDADRKSVVAIAREVKELASRAKNKKLRPEEMTDGTFSISNLGMFGIDAFAAVINPPEGAILAVGRAREEPVVRDGQIVIGQRMAMTLSCDHRVVDGAVGAHFLAELRQVLERPMQMLVF